MNKMRAAQVRYVFRPAQMWTSKQIIIIVEQPVRHMRAHTRADTCETGERQCVDPRNGGHEWTLCVAVMCVNCSYDISYFNAKLQSAYCALNAVTDRNGQTSHNVRMSVRVWRGLGSVTRSTLQPSAMSLDFFLDVVVVAVFDWFQRSECISIRNIRHFYSKDVFIAERESF